MGLYADLSPKLHGVEYTSGTGNFTVPANVYEIEYELVGASLRPTADKKRRQAVAGHIERSGVESPQSRIQDPCRFNRIAIETDGHVTRTGRLPCKSFPMRVEIDCKRHGKVGLRGIFAGARRITGQTVLNDCE